MNEDGYEGVNLRDREKLDIPLGLLSEINQYKENKQLVAQTTKNIEEWISIDCHKGQRPNPNYSFIQTESLIKIPKGEKQLGSYSINLSGINLSKGIAIVPRSYSSWSAINWTTLLSGNPTVWTIINALKINDIFGSVYETSFPVNRQNVNPQKYTAFVIYPHGGIYTTGQGWMHKHGLGISVLIKEFEVKPNETTVLSSQVFNSKEKLNINCKNRREYCGPISIGHMGSLGLEFNKIWQRFPEEGITIDLNVPYNKDNSFKYIIKAKNCDKDIYETNGKHVGTDKKTGEKEYTWEVDMSKGGSKTLNLMLEKNK